ncbi:MAG: PTS glucitol/sorbitol transporter subunit IIA [Streptococcaceae bacterium]|nr:PTS glucitol/sorbitol transporter subunit IIA [Streptococcaceae bacterium]
MTELGHTTFFFQEDVDFEVKNSIHLTPSVFPKVSVGMEIRYGGEK